MNDDNKIDRHKKYLEYVRILPEKIKQLESFKASSKRAAKVALGYKGLHKTTNKISEFECARRIKKLRKIKDLFDKEMKGLNELISDMQNVIFMYEDIHDIKRKNLDLNYKSTIDNEYNEEVTQLSLKEQEVRPTSEAIAWHKKNSWYGKEKYMKETKTAYAYHYQIVNEGIDADTPEYYDELNRRIFRAYPELYVIKLSK